MWRQQLVDSDFYEVGMLSVSETASASAIDEARVSASAIATEIGTAGRDEM